MTDIPAHLSSFEVRERLDGWYYRRPAGDESAEWSGPHETYEAAHQAACAELETLLAEHVAAQLLGKA